MSQEWKYGGDLLGCSLQVRESRLVADLLLHQYSAESWQQAILTDNLLQKRSPATAKRIALTLRKRLEPLEPVFWQTLRDGDDELATQVAFCSALVRNLLLVEYMETVVNDAYAMQAVQLEGWWWEEFLQDRAHRDPVIAGWTESSRKKMGQIVHRMLAEMGYLHSTSSRRLQHVLIRPEMKDLLENSGRHRVLACMQISSPRHL